MTVAEVRRDDAGADRIEHLRRAVAKLTRQRDDHAATIAQLRQRIDILNEEIAVGSMLDCQIDDLARARARLFAGDCTGGRDLIERVLDDLDPAWRARG